MAYAILWSPAAREDLHALSRREQVVLVAAIPQHLTLQPTEPSNKRKRLDRNPVGAAWELRIGDLRVFYDVEGTTTVRIERIGRKVRERLTLRGRTVEMRGDEY